MRLAARLSKALGIELVDSGDSVFDLDDHARMNAFVIDICAAGQRMAMRCPGSSSSERAAPPIKRGARRRSLHSARSTVSAIAGS